MPIDMSAATAKAPPRRVTPQKRPTSQPMVETSVRDKREEGLNGIAQIAQFLCAISGNYADGGAIGMHSPPLTHETAVLADDYEWLGNGIDLVIKVGPFTAVLTAGLPLALQLLANHKRIDATRLPPGWNVVPPEALDAQMRAQMMQMQAAQMKLQQEAMAEARRSAEEINRMNAEMASMSV